MYPQLVADVLGLGREELLTGGDAQPAQTEGMEAEPALEGAVTHARGYGNLAL